MLLSLFAINYYQYHLPRIYFLTKPNLTLVFSSFTSGLTSVSIKYLTKAMGFMKNIKYVNMDWGDN